MSLELHTLRPIQSMAISALFKYKRLMLVLPRQYGGKTETGIRLMRDLTGRPFTKTSLFLAKDKNSAKRATREKIMRLFEKELFSVNTENFYLKAVPSSCGFIESVDKEPDKLRGGTYSYIHWSEVAFSKIEQGFSLDDVYQKVINPTTSQTDGYVLLESTLNGKNQFYDLWEDYKDRKFHRLVVPFWMMVEMGLISEEIYLHEKSQYSELVFQQEFECEFVSFIGRSYPEADACITNVIPPRPFDKCVYAIDWGYHPSATSVLFAYKKGEKVIIFKELYKHKQRAPETAVEMQQVFDIYSITNSMGTADHEEDRVDDLNDANISVSKAKKTGVFGTRMLLKNLMHRGLIEIDREGCPNLIRELDICEWDGKKDGDIDYSKDSRGHFDGEASLRYLIREFFDIDEDQEPEDEKLVKLPGEQARREHVMKQQLLFEENDDNSWGH